MFENFWIAAGAAMLLGISKAGIKGISSVFVAAMAFVFGAKASTGILMPLLISADIVAVWYYQKHAHWSYIKKLGNKSNENRGNLDPLTKKMEP